jgi:hypothetical protein
VIYFHQRKPICQKDSFTILIHGGQSSFKHLPLDPREHSSPFYDFPISYLVPKYWLGFCGSIKSCPGPCASGSCLNPSYSGGIDEEDHGSKPAHANSSRDPISKIAIKKRAGGVAQGVGPEFKLQYCKKKKKSFPGKLQMSLGNHG